MKSNAFWPHRRHLLELIGAAAAAPAFLRTGWAASSARLDLKAAEVLLALRTGSPPTPAWSLESSAGVPARFKSNEDLQVLLSNEISSSIILNYIGFDGVNTGEPLLQQPPLAAGGQSKLTLPLRRSGTYFADARLLGDGAGRPFGLLPLVVADDGEPKADRDELFLIEDWRIDSGGNALAPGKDAGTATAIYTVNHKPAADIALPVNARLRLRIINGCQRAIIALRIADLDVRVMAIDSQPAEPFLARSGQLLIGPGSRIDAVIDATRPAGSESAITLFDGTTPTPLGRIIISSEKPIRPAPLPAAPAFSSAGLPTRIDLQGATRADIVHSETAPWVTPSAFGAAAKPAFRVKRGRNVVLTLSNPAKMPGTFHLHGHHFRLLDRLDDGWKPFWLDTLAFDAGQTQRIAFVAEYAGQWLMEFMPSAWASLRRVQHYTVE